MIRSSKKCRQEQFATTFLLTEQLASVSCSISDSVQVEEVDAIVK